MPATDGFIGNFNNPKNISHTMARIKKRGLDYFPLNTDFIHDRIVRRIMKREGDGALSVLIGTLSYIYAGEGYYVHADDLFYEDLSTCLYQQSAQDVRRILALAVEYGIFDDGLFSRHGILTSAEIQEQYLFSTKRRKSSAIEADYRLTDGTEEADGTEQESGTAAGNEKTARGGTVAKQAKNLCGAEEAGKACGTERTRAPFSTAEAPESCGTASTGEPFGPEGADGARGLQNATFTAQNATSRPHSTAEQSRAQQSVAQENREYPLLHSSPETGGTQGAGCPQPAGRKEDDALRKKEEAATRKKGDVSPRKERDAATCREWTAADIDRLQPPQDGVKRNLDGLKYNLRLFDVPVREQYAVILKSNFGAIGHPMWRGFEALRTSHGKIRQPGKYLLSLCRNG